MKETHQLNFECFEVRLTNDEDGEWISFHDMGKCILSIDWDELREIVDFVAIHGSLKMRVPYICEYEDSRDGMEAGK